jgi:ribose transport system ATP-binding protein
MKILAGIYDATSGRIVIKGKDVRFRAPSDAKMAGISIVPQEFNLCPDLTVAENVFLGVEPLASGGLLDEDTMHRKTEALLAELGAPISPDAMISGLSAAQKQLVEICKALAFDAQILILDEPTTVLTKPEIEHLFTVMRWLKSRGIAMIYVSHKLREIKEICDRVAILRDGDLVYQTPIGQIGIEEMASRMVGRELKDIFPAPTQAHEGVLLEVRNLSSPNTFEGISFSLHKGEILGLAGLVGAGRTEVAEAIMGLRPSSGDIFVAGKRLHGVHGASARDAVAAGIGYLPEDRQGSGVVVPFSVAENVTLVSLPSYCKALGVVDRTRERERTGHWRDLFNIKIAGVDQRLEELSGGNQQKVSLAKSLDPEPQVLIVDEPTRGVDVGAKHEIYRLINDLAKKGIAVLFISSELEEIIGMCQRVLVMREGKAAGFLEGDAISEQSIMFLATGVQEGALVK